MRAKLPDPLFGPALRAALAATAVVLIAAFVGAAVRLLPWVLDPSLPWSTLAPFSRSLFAVAVEAAVLTGWPVGWALAAQRLVERDEARVLALLGEPPSRTVARLAPQALFFAVALALTSAALGRDAVAPGRVVNALLAKGREACQESKAGVSHGIPFVSATWLCFPEPRLVGRAPFGGVVFTASGARVNDDLRRIDLDDARLALRANAAGGSDPLTFQLHVDTLSLRNMAPWARASSLSPWFRAAIVTASGMAAAWTAAYVLLRFRRKRVGGAGAAAFGAAGPLAALAALRSLEVRVPDASDTEGVANGALSFGKNPGWFLAFGLVPLCAVLAVALVYGVFRFLPLPKRAGTK